MGGDHGHHHKYEVPDYRIYKVEDCPKLVKVQTALAQKGLKDPWLRFVHFHINCSSILHVGDIGCYDYPYMLDVLSFLGIPKS
jgi:hypothetical protein